MSAPTTEDRSGQVLLGKLRVIRLLGQGGMGQVYEVEHLITRHRRALKIMHARYADSNETVARFIREAGVAGTLKTPHVVETYDAGQLEDGSPYVLMELLRGESLSSLYDASAGIAPGRVVGIVCQVLEGLHVAHEAGIVHRDVKPDNVFLGRDERGQERVRLLDFGISKFTHGTADYAGTLTSDGAMMGTPFYMSPEQASGAREVDERSDLYSTAVMLYEGLARRRPFEAVSLPALVIKIHAGDHARLHDALPNLAPGLADVVERAMHKDRTLRYESARQLLAALVPFADSGYVASLHTLKEGAQQAMTLGAPAVRQSAVLGVAPKSAPPPSARPAWVIPAAIATVVAVALMIGAFAMGASTTPQAATPTAPVAAAPPVPVTPPPPEAPVAPPPVITPPVVVAPPVVAERPRTPRPHPPESSDPPVHAGPVHTGPVHTGHGLVRDPTAAIP